MTPFQKPNPGDVQMHVLHETNRFIGWMPVAEIDARMASVERRLGIPEAGRDDLMTHIRLRLLVVERLKDREHGEGDFIEWVAATIMWLAMNHCSNGGDVRNALEIRGRNGAPCILSIGIADSPGAVPGTSWSFHVDDHVIDARDELSRTPAGTVRA